MALSTGGRFVLFVCLFVIMLPAVKSFCPRKSAHGWWLEDGDRCILRCESGFEPSGCHVIRYIRGEWNHEIPHCQEEPIVSVKTLAAVAYGSLTAMLQPPFNAAGIWLALPQNAGIIGAAARTITAVVAVTGATTYATSSLFSNCESE